MVVEGSPKPEENYEIINNLLKKKKEVTGFFITSDIIAYGVLDTLKSLGIDVPEHASIVGFDDISFSKYLCVPLTTISQPKYELGKIAANKVDPNVKTKNRLL